MSSDAAAAAAATAESKKDPARDAIDSLMKARGEVFKAEHARRSKMLELFQKQQSYRQIQSAEMIRNAFMNPLSLFGGYAGRSLDPLLFIYGDSCPGCHAFAPILESFMSSMPGLSVFGVDAFDAQFSDVLGYLAELGLWEQRVPALVRLSMLGGGGLAGMALPWSPRGGSKAALVRQLKDVYASEKLGQLVEIDRARLSQRRADAAMNRAETKRDSSEDVLKAIEALGAKASPAQRASVESLRDLALGGDLGARDSGILTQVLGGGLLDDALGFDGGEDGVELETYLAVLANPLRY